MGAQKRLSEKQRADAERAATEFDTRLANIRNIDFSPTAELTDARMSRLEAGRRIGDIARQRMDETKARALAALRDSPRSLQSAGVRAISDAEAAAQGAELAGTQATLDAEMGLAQDAESKRRQEIQRDMALEQMLLGRAAQAGDVAGSGMYATDAARQDALMGLGNLATQVLLNAPGRKTKTTTDTTTTDTTGAGAPKTEAAGTGMDVTPEVDTRSTQAGLESPIPEIDTRSTQAGLESSTPGNEILAPGATIADVVQPDPVTIDPAQVEGRPTVMDDSMLGMGPSVAVPPAVETQVPAVDPPGTGSSLPPEENAARTQEELEQGDATLKALQQQQPAITPTGGSGMGALQGMDVLQEELLSGPLPESLAAKEIRKQRRQDNQAARQQRRADNQLARQERLAATDPINQERRRREAAARQAGRTENAVARAERRLERTPTGGSGMGALQGMDALQDELLAAAPSVSAEGQAVDPFENTTPPVPMGGSGLGSMRSEEMLQEELLGDVSPAAPINERTLDLAGLSRTGRLLDMLGEGAQGMYVPIEGGGGFVDYGDDFARGGNFIGEEGGMTEGEFDHDTNKKAIVDEESGEKEGEMTGGEMILNPDQADAITDLVEKGDEEKLLAFMKDLLSQPQFQDA